MSQCCYNLKNTPLDPDGNTWTTDDLQLLGNRIRWRSMRPEEPGPKHFRAYNIRGSSSSSDASMPFKSYGQQRTSTTASTNGRGALPYKGSVVPALTAAAFHE